MIRRKALKIYAIASFAVVIVGTVFVTTVRLPISETWNSMFAIAAIAFTTIISTVMVTKT
jgi:hypothetical protein